MSASRCGLCAGSCADDATICSTCERTYGPKVSRLLARAEVDPGFAQACLANLPGPLRARFAALLGKRFLRSGGDTRVGPGLRSARPRADPKWQRTAN
jgi:hypothetical protein